MISFALGSALLFTGGLAFSQGATIPALLLGALGVAVFWIGSK